MEQNGGARAYLAVDLGAGSGRVILGRFDGDALRFEELHRFPTPQHRVDGHDRWDLAELEAQVLHGLSRAAGAVDPARLRSVGVDSWAVDYGLLDADGRLLGDPVCYRDARTDGRLEELLAVVPAERIYARTGIQFQPFNTLVQLFAQVRAGEWPEQAHRLLLIPDLVHRRLCGCACSEVTNASTTQLLDAATRGWDAQLATAAGVAAGVLPPLEEAGARLGALLPEVQAATGLPPLAVVAPGTHDTASAVAGTPLAPGEAYVSAGTWSLVGVEASAPRLGDRARAANLTNEAGVQGTTRLLRNVMGLWILEFCRKTWEREGRPLAHEDLAALAGGQHGAVFLDPDDARFLHPADMVAEVRGFLRETGQRDAEEPCDLARVILESLALRTAEVVECLERVTGESITSIRVVGGGSRNDLLNQATASAAGRPVLAGPAEATAIGNLLVQAVADGRFATLADARAFVARCTPVRRFEPRDAAAWRAARARFAQLGGGLRGAG